MLNTGDLVFDGRTQDLYNGERDLNEWGLSQPVLAVLSAAMGLSAYSVEEFCQQLFPKEGDER